jgi:hypothetical protein
MFRTLSKRYCLPVITTGQYNPLYAMRRMNCLAQISVAANVPSLVISQVKIISNRLVALSGTLPPRGKL